MRMRKLAAVGFVAALLVVGCGGSDEEAEPVLTDQDIARIGEVSQSLETAAAKGDGKVLCDSLAAGVLEENFPSPAKCASGAERAFKTGAFKDLEIVEVTGVSPTEARVSFKKGQPMEITFVKQDDDWLIEDGSAGGSTGPTG